MLSYIPTWVFAVLALLLALGFVQSRPRQVSPSVIRSVAIGLAAYSLWGVFSSFGSTVQPVLLWVVGLVGAIMLAPSVAPLAGLSFIAASGKVQVPGSWLPLALMLGIFCIKFGLGFAAGTGAPVQAGSFAAGACALCLGLLSGVFAARARSIAVVARRQQSAV